MSDHLRTGWRRLLVTDPGLQRTYFAGRITLAVALGLALALPLARASAQPTAILMLAASTAAVTSMAVGRVRTDPLRVVGLSWVVALACVSVAVALSGHRLASLATFVGVMALGAWAARFGLPGFGVGMVAFMSYFFTLFLRASLDHLPWLLAAASLGVLATGVLRLVVLRDPEPRRLRRLLVALRERTAALAHDFPAGALAAPLAGPAEQRALRRAAIAIDEIVLQVHDLLDDAPGVVADPQLFRRHLFAVVTLSHLLVLRAMDGGASEEATPDAPLAAPVPDPAARLSEHLAALEAPPEERATMLLPEEPTLHPGESELDPDPSPGAPPGADAPPGGRAWLTGSTRTAVQVAVAGAVSIAAGLQLSPQRWYWAAVSAFVVFANTGSRAATLRKAVERLLGTIGGIAAGLVLGYLLAGRSGLELVVVFPLLFVGFWMLQASYAIMIGMITILLAVLYELLGILTVEVLLLRLGETLVGAGIGVIVAYFVLPTRTREAVDEALRAYLGALDELLGALARAAARGRAAEAEVLAAVRGLDRALAGLRGVVRPAVASVPGRRSHALRQEVILALTARYWVHRLAARILFHPGTPDPIELERHIEAVRARIARMRSGSGGNDAPRAMPPGVLPDAAPLFRLDALLAELDRARANRA